MGKLTATGLPGLLKKVGRHVDGDGLCLLVRKPGQGAWVARLQSDGKRRDFGLGPCSLVSLSEAREKCRTYKRELRQGRDPLMLSRPSEGAARLFRDVALKCIEAKLSKAGQDTALGRLERHVFPKIGGLMLQSINADVVAECLSPIWITRPETARKCRLLILRTLRFGLPDGASLTGMLARAVSDRLPNQPRGANFTALEYARIPEVMSKLERKDGMGAMALRFAILTASRSQEVRGARWREADLEAGVWTIAADRTKMRREHRVPLSEPALAVLATAASLRRAETDLIFPSANDGMLSDATLLKALRDADTASKTGKVTQHGMRASFKTWAVERTSFRDEISEACIAHQVSGAVRRAYLRSTFEDQRRELMTAWGRYCAGELGGEVVPLRAA